MITKAALFNKLQLFLSERVPSKGGTYAPVSKGDMQDLYDIFGAVIQLKYGPDCDGDLPVRFQIVDRNERMGFGPYPFKYPHKAQGMAELVDIFCAATGAVKIAIANQEMVARYIEEEAKTK